MSLEENFNCFDNIKYKEKLIIFLTVVCLLITSGYCFKRKNDCNSFL